MDKFDLYVELSKLDLPSQFLQREIAILNRKKTTKKDPYVVLLTILTYLYCRSDVERFLKLFQQFIESEMDAHFAQDHSLWFFVESSILLYSGLIGDTKHDSLIVAKGIAGSRLQGRLLNTTAENLLAEIGEFSRGHSLPKGTIVNRYQSMVLDCLVILRLTTGAPPEISVRLDRYRRLFLASVDSFRLSDREFLDCLKKTSSDFV